MRTLLMIFGLNFSQGAIPFPDETACASAAQHQMFTYSHLYLNKKLALKPVYIDEWQHLKKNDYNQIVIGCVPENLAELIDEATAERLFDMVEHDKAKKKGVK